MQILSYILIVLVVAGFALIAYLLTRKPKEDVGMTMLQNQLNELRRAVDDRLAETHKTVQQQHSVSTKIIQDITQELTKLGGFAEQLQGLENILKNPKQRGILGEFFLEALLQNVFQPHQYKMQYEFGDGKKVDAVIFLGEQIIPIDSKFSLENYNKLAEEKDPVRQEQLEKQFKQDLKNRIDETAKYIRPKENTTDYAFMFIPAEKIYYDMLVSQVGTIKVSAQDLIEYAHRQRHVIVVSPNTFYAWLQLFVEGMKRMQIEKSVKEIIKRVGGLGRHLASYEDYLKRLGNNLSTTVNMYNSAYKEFSKIDKDVVKISGQESGIEPLALDKPEAEH